MTTVPHDRPVATDRPLWWRTTEIWASLAITAMWVAVIVTAFAGSDVRSADNTGNVTSIPAAVAVALFAAIGSWAVARYAFRQRE